MQKVTDYVRAAILAALACHPAAHCMFVLGGVTVSEVLYRRAVVAARDAAR